MKSNHYKAAGFCFLVLLAAAIFVAFEPVLDNDFTGYDDDEYVAQNVDVNGGLSVKSLIWAFTSPHQSMWHPLTSLSHMLDCQLYGLNASGHHLTNLLFHIFNSFLLFWVLKRMTGGFWQSAFVSVVFALHPLQVESVAWISERKNVLSAFFSILTIIAYVRYAERRRIGRYVLTVLSFGLALMSKGVVVTLPFVLLLLDYWPLKRFGFGSASNPDNSVKSPNSAITYSKTSIGGLIWEKIPLLCLSAVASVITFNVQQSGGALQLNMPLLLRIANAMVSYISYIGKLVYPANLIILYPHRGNNAFPLWQPITCLLVLVSVTIVVIYMIRRRRYLAVGWFWYLGTLVPVAGFIQAGGQSMADRYMYLPSLGILIMVAWSVTELTAKLPYRRVLLAISVCVLIAGMLLCTRRQVGFWENDLRLFGHAVKVTQNNSIMHGKYGRALLENGRIDEAIQQCRRSLEINPKFFKARNTLGVMLSQRGEFDEAIKHFTITTQLKPRFSEGHYNLGHALYRKGQLNEALGYLRKAVQLNPNDFLAQYMLGRVLATTGRASESIEYFEQSLKIKPDFVDVHRDLGYALSRLNRLDEAIESLNMAWRLKPNSPSVYNKLGIIYGMQGKYDLAIQSFNKALQLKPGHADATKNLKLALQKQSEINRSIKREKTTE